MIVLISRFQPGGLLALAQQLWERRGKATDTTVAAEAGHAS